MENILRDIKEGTLKQMYLLYGEENYLIDQFKQNLKAAFLFEENSMNFHLLEGKDISIEHMIDLSETIPFLSDKRVFFIENSELYKGKNEKFLEYLEALPSTSYFVFIEKNTDEKKKVEKSIKNTKFCKLITKRGYVTEFKRQKEDLLINWIGRRLKQEQKKISIEVAQYIITKVGVDMASISCEIEKLVSYIGEKEVIEKSDIDIICTTNITQNIFDLIKVISNGNKEKALSIYHELYLLKIEPIVIISNLAKEYKKLFLVQSLLPAAKSHDEIGTLIGCPKWYVKDYIALSRTYRNIELQHCLELCMEAEEAIKTGKISKILALELLIISLIYKET